MARPRNSAHPTASARRRRNIVPDEKDKPVLDEQTFARLLEAAFVLQEHNRELQKLERNLALHTDHLAAREPSAPAAQKPSLSILPSPDPETRTSETRTLEVPAVAAPVVATQTVATQPVATQSVATPAVEDFLPEPTPPQPIPAESLPAASAPAPPPLTSDYTLTLAQIVETQHQIQARHLELENAMSLVAQRVTEIARAGGAAIGFVDGKNVRYRGVAGLMTLPAGTEVPFEKALCVASLKTGQVIRCADVNPEFLLDPEECRRRGIQAMIAVPIFHEGGIAGGLELYYATTQAFTEQDVHTCQLMAGLITEALAKDEELGWKKSLASERAVMLEALEKLKPNLDALVDKPAKKGSASRGAGSRKAGFRSSVAAVSSAPSVVCLKCGHQLVGGEQFCGKCGARRSDSRDAYEAPSMQSKVSSLRHMQEAKKKNAVAAPANGDLERLDPLVVSDPARPEKPLADSIEEEMPELFAAPELRIGKMSDPEEFKDAISKESIEVAAKPEIVIPTEPAPEEAAPEVALHEEAETEVPSVETALVKPVPVANWSSATTAREFLEQLAEASRPGALARFWKARRGDIYLAVAVILVLAVVRWGIWSSHSVSATGKPTAAATAPRKPAPEPDLSAFDRMLISLGLADAPPAPVYHGNPDAQVWIDLHTALYYCPGSDLYGKTTKGRFTSQRAAQLDQFEPAYRKACD